MSDSQPAHHDDPTNFTCSPAFEPPFQIPTTPPNRVGFQQQEARAAYDRKAITLGRAPNKPGGEGAQQQQQQQQQDEEDDEEGQEEHEEEQEDSDDQEFQEEEPHKSESEERLHQCHLLSA